MFQIVIVIVMRQGRNIHIMASRSCRSVTARPDRAC
jgi:hypothetical protein